MPKLPVLSGKAVVNLLSRIGYSHIRTSGSHAIMKRENPEKGTITIPVPLHPELAKGTLKSIMNQAGLSLDDLLTLLGKR